MPASKVRAIVEKEFGDRRLTFEQVLYLKRYFGVSFAAMLRKTPPTVVYYYGENEKQRMSQSKGNLWMI
jgi:hypothetical protein